MFLMEPFQGIRVEPSRGSLLERDSMLEDVAAVLLRIPSELQISQVVERIHVCIIAQIYGLLFAPSGTTVSPYNGPFFRPPLRRAVTSPARPRLPASLP